MGYNNLFTVGNLLLFKPFYFPDGGKPTPKFFLVLYKEEKDALLVSLPTSKDHIPTDIEAESGCIELPERNINAFILPKGVLVTEDFSFKCNTFIYGCNLHEYSMKNILQPIEDKSSEVTIIGKIKSNLFYEIIKCLKESSAVKNRYRRKLGERKSYIND